MYCFSERLVLLCKCPLIYLLYIANSVSATAISFIYCTLTATVCFCVTNEAVICLTSDIFALVFHYCSMQFAKKQFQRIK